MLLMLCSIDFQGVVPATGFLKGSGIDITDRGFVTVNKVCEDN